MFNKLKKALEDFVADKVTDYIESVDQQSKAPPPPSPPTVATSPPPVTKSQAPPSIPEGFSLPDVDNLPPIQRVEKAPEVYEPITSFSADDIPKLIKALDDPDPEQQVHAIQMAHFLMKQSPSQIYAICEVLLDVMQTDPDAPARAAAAKALSVIKNPKYVSNPTNSDRAIKMQYEQTVEALSSVMRADDDLLTRQNAAESLALTGTDSKMRQQFTILRQENGDDIDPFIRMVMSMHLGGGMTRRFDDAQRAQWKDALLQAYVDYPEMEGVTRATITHAKIPEAVPYFVKAILDSDDKNLREGLVTSLGQLGTENALDPLLTFLHSEDIYISRSAITGLKLLKDLRATPHLKKFKASLPSSDPRHRTIDEAIIESGDAGNMDDHIATLQDDKRLFDHKNALNALGKEGSSKAIHAVIEYLKTTQNKNMAYDAFNVLLAHPSDEAAHAMIDRVCDGTLGYRQVSYNFVSKMRMSHAIGWLDKAVDERATPQAMIGIKKDRDLLKRF